MREVTDEATRQFGYLFHEDQTRKQDLQTCCKHIDNLAERFNGVSYDIEVNEDTMDISIALNCDEFQIEDHSDEICVLMDYTKYVSFKKYAEDVVQIKFIFDGIWV
ncbi:MAG: hypothetical protein LUG64_02380 [Clostridiales bacterium]|nr:hypothetical protein [Clostridiales bacterium]